MTFAPEVLRHYPIRLDPLPVGWTVGCINDIAESIRPGFASGRNNTTGIGVVQLRPMNISKQGRIDLSLVKYVPADHAVWLQDGDVLFNNTNSPELIGKTAVIRNAGHWTFSNHMTRIRPVPGVLPEFLAHQLHYLWMQGYFRHQCVNHVNQASLSSDRLSKAVPLVLPPTAEQERIVAAIDEEFSRLDTGLDALHQARRGVERLRTAVLHNAVRPTKVDGGSEWRASPIGDLAWVTSGATPARSRRDYWEGGSIPWVTSSLVNNGTIAAAREFVTPLALRETAIKLMPAGTLLVAMYGEGQTRGRCSELAIAATTNQACAAIVLPHDSECTKDYLKLFLEASYLANRRLSAGGVQPNLSVRIIKGMIVRYPRKEEQATIVHQAALDLEAIDRLAEALTNTPHRFDSVRAAILTTAFSGRLAPSGASPQADRSDDSLRIASASDDR